MTDSTVRVVQLNIGSLLDPDWDHRRHEVVAWLDRIDPDVVCLQEVWEDANRPNTAGWIVDNAGPGRWHWCFGGFAFPADLWSDPSLLFGSAILSRWPIDEHHVVELPTGETDDDRFRRIPAELLHARTAGLHLFSTHLASAPPWGDLRRRQVLALDDHVRELAADSFPSADGASGPTSANPPIVCGDFNAEPDSDEIRFLAGLTMLDGRTTFYQDAWRVAGDGGPGLTQDWRRNPYAAGLNVHRKRIDYVFVGDSFRRADNAGRVVEATVAFDEPITGIHASDHYGLVVDVVWPTRPA